MQPKPVPVIPVGVVIGLCLGTPLASAQDWAEEYFPYRLQLTLEGPTSGPTALALPPEKIILALEPVCADVCDFDSFAFEKATLVDPKTGAKVGGFRFVPVGEALVLDEFAAVAGGGDTSWLNYGGKPALELQRVTEGEDSFEALNITSDKIINRGFYRSLKLKPGLLYVLSYWICSDAEDSNLGLSIVDPKKRLFSQEHHSYFNSLTPRGKWTRHRVLYRAGIAEPHLQLSTVFLGRCGIADLRLQQVDLRLIAELPEATDRLDFYCVLRAGHRLPQPVAAMDWPGAVPPAVEVRSVKAEMANLNAGAVLVEQNGIRAWSLAGDLPLKARLLQSLAPGEPTGDRPLQVRLFRGEAETLLFAVDTGTPRAQFLDVGCDVPLAVRVEELAEISVFDGPLPEGKLIERRLDALAPLNFELAPPSSTGVHVIAVTLTADPEAEPGTLRGNVSVRVRTQAPDDATLVLPVEVSVLPVVVKPAGHFGTMFAGQHFLVRYAKSAAFTKDSTTVAEFHGYSAANLEALTAMSLTNLSTQDAQRRPVRDLARKYFHRMLDYQVLPQSPCLYSSYTYQVSHRGEGQAPALSHWQFADYDAALDEFVIGRDMPWFALYHTNGHAMHTLRLIDGVTYSLSAAEDNLAWKHLPREQYLQLVGDFFDALAKHLDEKGVLDRAVFVIDESGPETYDLIHEYVRELKARPYAKRIRVAHTTYKISTWTRRSEDGRLLLDDILDIPMPVNDDHFNFLEPEWNARFSPAGKEQWVYYVETDHFNLSNAGMSTILTPLKLGHFGAEGWYCWASFIWSMPYVKTDTVGFEYPSGPVVNPWLNPFYHHGPGVVSFFYPPDPRGPAVEPTDLIIPSYRLALMRDGIELRALFEVLTDGRDDAGSLVTVDPGKLAQAQHELRRLFAANPVQWYLSYHSLRRARDLLYQAAVR